MVFKGVFREGVEGVPRRFKGIFKGFLRGF